MRKWFSVLLALILSLIPIVSFACQIPLERQGKRVYLHDQSQAELVSYNVFFRIRTGFSSVNTSMVIKNQNAEEPAAFIMGMPVQIDNISKIRDLSVVSEVNPLKSSRDLLLRIHLMKRKPMYRAGLYGIFI